MILLEWARFTQYFLLFYEWLEIFGGKGVSDGTWFESILNFSEFWCFDRYFWIFCRYFQNFQKIQIFIEIFKFLKFWQLFLHSDCVSRVSHRFPQFLNFLVQSNPPFATLKIRLKNNEFFFYANAAFSELFN